MPKNLLLADDSKTIQQAVSMTFAREDVKLTTVEDGEAAFRAAKASKPDIILADVTMPGLGGYELCQRVRADAAIRDVPVLLLGGGMPIDPAKAQAVGANGHMPKPFDSTKLIDQVKQILANPRAAAAPAAARPAAPAAPRPSGPPPAAARPPPLSGPPKPAAQPGAAGSTMMMSKPPPAGAPRPGLSAPPPGARPPPPAAARPPPPAAPATKPSMPPVAKPPLTGAPSRTPLAVGRPPGSGKPPATPSMPSAA